MKIKNFQKKAFFILLSIFIIIKLVILLTSGSIRDNEECTQGNTAMALINGLSMPFHDYIYQHYSGGTLVVGALTVPFYLVFGVSGISLKLVALSFSIALFFMFFYFMKIFFGYRASIIGSVLFIFAPPFFLLRSLASEGDHFESIIFEFAVMLVFLLIFFKNKKETKYFALLGLLVGFGLWFSYKILFVIFTVLFFWFVFDKLFFLKKYFFVFIIFFLIGFSPWVLYNFTHDFAGIDRLYDGFKETSLQDSFFQLKAKKFLNLTTVNLLDSFYFRNKIFANIYYSLLFISFFSLLVLNRKSLFMFFKGLVSKIDYKNLKPLTFVQVYFAFIFILFSLSSYNLHFYATGAKKYVFLWPIYPIMFIFIALFLVKLINTSKLLKYFSFMLLFVVIIFAVAESSWMILFFNPFDSANSEHFISYKPYCNFVFGTNFGIKYPEHASINSCTNIANSFHRNICFTGFGSGLVINGLMYESLNVSNSFKICRELKDDFSRYCVLGVSYFLVNIDGPVGIQNYCEELEHNDRVYCYRGISSQMVPVIGLNSTIDFCKSIPDKKLMLPCYDGIAQTLGRLLAYKREPKIGFCESLEQGYRNYCYKSFGTGLHIFYEHNDNYSVSLCKSLDTNYSESCLKGLKDDFLF